MSIIETKTLMPADTATPVARAARIGLNAVLAGLWLWLYRAIFGYLGVIFSREDFRTNQVVLLGVIVLIVIQIRQGHVRFRLDALPHLHRPALGLALVGSILYLGVERYLDVNTLAASLFGLASYGLLGLWLQPSQWRKGLPAALLLIGALPFGEHMQTFIGYPLRILTAAIVRDGLAAAGVAPIGIDTVLILENGVSKVDLPCSGIRSLWTGALFLIAATWIMRRSLDLKWLLIALIMAGLLFIANLARVGVLVVVGQVAGWHLAAEILHVPLGVLGFGAVCAAVVKLLQWAGGAPGATLETPPDLSRANPSLPALSRPAWLVPALLVSFVIMGLSYTPRPAVGLSQSPPAWNFPAGLITEPMPLTPTEFDWLVRDGAESADRHRFEWRGISGSMILITSQTWRAHHRPERCFEVYGLSLDDSHTHLVGPDFPVRYISLGNGKGRNLRSATYWFQSTGHTTDDYATRIWADLPPDRERWVLVSILFDDVHDPNDVELQTLYTALHETIALFLKGGSSS